MKTKRKKGSPPDKLDYPHCLKPLKRIFEIRVGAGVLYWKGNHYYWATESTELVVADKTREMEIKARIGCEPEYSSTLFLCPNCFYTLPQAEVEQRIGDMAPPRKGETLEEFLELGNFGAGKAGS